MCGAERHNTRHVGVGVRTVIRLVPWDNPRQASGTRVRGQVRPNTYEDSLCQETHCPYERFFPFFRLGGSGVVSSRCCVLT
jgi:hypothetical protein